jgi:hypothetical protein
MFAPGACCDDGCPCRPRLGHEDRPCHRDFDLSLWSSGVWREAEPSGGPNPARALDRGAGRFLFDLIDGSERPLLPKPPA